MEHQEFQARMREGTLNPRPRVNDSATVRFTHLDATQRAVLELYALTFGVLPLLYMISLGRDRSSTILVLGTPIILMWLGFRTWRLRQDLILERAAADRDFFERMCNKGIIEFRPQKFDRESPSSAGAQSN